MNGSGTRGGGDTPPRFAEVLQTWLTTEGLSELRSLAKIRECWSEVVGDEVASHTDPIRHRDGVVVVAVDHSAWATELKFLESRIRRALNNLLSDGAVTRLEARVRHPDS